MEPPVLPDGLEHVRTTDLFHNDTVPPGLLRAHQVAKNVWGRLVVHTGAVGFVFEDDEAHPIEVRAGGSVAIPPQRRHRVVLGDPATFAVEFHRFPEAVPVTLGRESTGLTGGDPD